MTKDPSIITSDDILGKQAIDSEGEILGIIVKLHIDRNNKTITGITIDQGFMKPDLFVGFEYIKTLGIDAIFLNSIPPEKYKGEQVINHDGSFVGIVDSVQYQGNKLTNFTIKKKGHSFSKQQIQINISAVHEIGDRIILKKNYHL